MIAFCFWTALVFGDVVVTMGFVVWMFVWILQQNNNSKQENRQFLLQKSSNLRQSLDGLIREVANTVNREDCQIEFRRLFEQYRRSLIATLDPEEVCLQLDDVVTKWETAHNEILAILDQGESGRYRCSN